VTHVEGVVLIDRPVEEVFDLVADEGRSDRRFRQDTWSQRPAIHVRGRLGSCGAG
jgi:hypothetical protein